MYDNVRIIVLIPATKFPKSRCKIKKPLVNASRFFRFFFVFNHVFEAVSLLILWIWPQRFGRLIWCQHWWDHSCCFILQFWWLSSSFCSRSPIVLSCGACCWWIVPLFLVGFMLTSTNMFSNFSSNWFKCPKMMQTRKDVVSARCFCDGQITNQHSLVSPILCQDLLPRHSWMRNWIRCVWC